jgi:hypothetical protein
VLIHGRDDARGQQTIDDIVARTGNLRLHWFKADLASLAEVRDFGPCAVALQFLAGVNTQGHGKVVNSGAVTSPMRAVRSVRRCTQ